MQAIGEMYSDHMDPSLAGKWIMSISAPWKMFNRDLMAPKETS